MLNFGCDTFQQVLLQQKEGVEGILPVKQQQAQQSRIKVETMRDSLWEAEDAAIQAKSKLDEIEAAVRRHISFVNPKPLL